VSMLLGFLTACAPGSGRQAVLPVADYRLVTDPMQPTTVPLITNLTDHNRQIFLRGQQLGNRANVFSKVGDSLTVATYVLYPIGWGAYNLHTHTSLQPVIDYFSAPVAETENSFSHISLAAENGWTTQSVLDPTRANPQVCQRYETPLLCEYRVMRPTIALILLGTNDVSQLPAEVFRGNLRRIIEISINRGVIPVISTLPDRASYSDQIRVFNGHIRELAREFGTPLWDYGAFMATLTNGGLAADGVHPSWPPGDYAAAADFSPENLQYGYTLRNLTALQVLDDLWRQVILAPS
jgi:hypothetical protein